MRPACALQKTAAGRAKLMFNLTTCAEDLLRFGSHAGLRAALDGFDGLELMCIDDPAAPFAVQAEDVVGLHMGYFPCWLALWEGDWPRLLSEFGSEENVAACFGGTDRAALLRAFRRDLANARRYGAQYVVFHISDATTEESFTLRYRHSDEDVIRASAAPLNELFDGQDGSVALLMENLWQPGLTFTAPAMTRLLLDLVAYENKGFMLDTGHLMHTNTALRTEQEALCYIHRMLDAHGPLCRHIRGVHLHQSLTGAYCEQVRRCPPPLCADYAARCAQMYEHAFAVDRHEPFTCPGVGALLERIAPEFLTFEFITSSRAQHARCIAAQRAALAGCSLLPR